MPFPQFHQGPVPEPEPAPEPMVPEVVDRRSGELENSTFESPKYLEDVGCKLGDVGVDACFLLLEIFVQTGDLTINPVKWTCS